MKPNLQPDKNDGLRSACYDLFKHPSRVVISGKSRSGKTTKIVDLAMQCYIPMVKNVFVVSPTYRMQTTFDAIRQFVPEENYFTTGRRNVFKV